MVYQANKIPFVDLSEYLADQIIGEMDKTEGIPLEVTVWYDDDAGRLECLAYIGAPDTAHSQSAEYETQIALATAVGLVVTLLGAIAGFLYAVGFFQVTSTVTASVKGSDWGWVPLVAIVIAGGYLFSNLGPVLQSSARSRGGTYPYG